MTAIAYHDTVNDVQGLGQSGKAPFARAGWFALLDQAGKSPLMVSAREGDDALLLPLAETPQGLEILSNWYAFTWQPLITGAPSPDLHRQIAEGLAQRTSRVVLEKLADEDGTASRLENAFRDAGWTVLREQCDINHVLPVNGRSYADYLASRPGQLRTTLKRKAKKVEVSLSRKFDVEDWAAYEGIYRNSWKPEEGDPDLLRKFAQSESEAGRYLFGIATAEGKPVAAQFWTVDNGTAYIHKLAHLQDAQKISPGTTLTAALFAEVIDKDRVALVDFGTGDDGYKPDWMEQVRPRYRLTCLRASAPRNWPVIGKAMIRKLVSRAPAG